MQQKKQESYYRTVGAIFMLIYSATLVHFTFKYGSPFPKVLPLAASAVVTILLISKGKKSLITIGFGILAMTSYINYPLTVFSRYVVVFNLLTLIGIVFATIITYLSHKHSTSETVKKLWFLPGILTSLSAIMLICKYWDYYGRCLDKGRYLFCIIDLLYFLSLPIALFYTMRSMTSLEKNSSHTKSIRTSNDFYIDIVKHILLLLLTCGIWGLIWIYKTTDYLNSVPNEEYHNPTTKLLLCMFVPFYVIYWIYVSAQRIDKLSCHKGVSSDSATLYLILAIFIPILPKILMQDKINSIVTDSTPYFTIRQPVRTSENNAVKPFVDVPEELKRYKELLDHDVITQEEFETKKKQLLNL